MWNIIGYACLVFAVLCVFIGANRAASTRNGPALVYALIIGVFWLALGLWLTGNMPASLTGA